MRLRDCFLIVQRPPPPAEGGEPIAAALEAGNKSPAAVCQRTMEGRTGLAPIYSFLPPPLKKPFPPPIRCTEAEPYLVSGARKGVRGSCPNSAWTRRRSLS